MKKLGNAPTRVYIRTPIKKIEVNCLETEAEPIEYFIDKTGDRLFSGMFAKEIDEDSESWDGLEMGDEY